MSEIHVPYRYDPKAVAEAIKKFYEASNAMVEELRAQGFKVTVLGDEIIVDVPEDKLSDLRQTIDKHWEEAGDAGMAREAVVQVLPPRPVED